MNSFGDRLAQAVQQVGAPLALGLDPHLHRLPSALQRSLHGPRDAAWRRAAAEAVTAWGCGVLDAAIGQVAAIKVQFAFYEQLGSPGWAALEATVAAARARGLLVIADAKRGDIASTAAAYAEAILDPAGPLGCDAVTLSPWVGLDAIEPFLQWSDRGVFVLLRTTNPGSDLLQAPAAETLCAHLSALGAAHSGAGGLSAVGVVVGAQRAPEAAALRTRLPQAWFLVPGVGAQGGTLADARAGARADGLGSLVVCSRSLLFPSCADPAYEADPTAFVAERIAEMRRAMAAAG